MDFAKWFEEATGRVPHRFQQAFAETKQFSNLVFAPTGSGKTATAVLGWLWRRFHHPNDAVRAATPRRLVYCLPMRTLVEQTVKAATEWLTKLGIEDVRVHKLLGGDAKDDWLLCPEKAAILVGTQDMLLSRALNRGYGEGRFCWPIDFGLLNNDCLWVYDEVQLMAAGVPTSAQLAGLREKLGTCGRCDSVWMSATLERSWLDTVDFREKLASAPSLAPSDEELQTGELGKRMTAKKTLAQGAVAWAKHESEIAKLAMTEHVEGSLTLIVLNTVNRAVDVFDALRKLKPKAELMLLHSRFRAAEREHLNARLAERPEKGRILVSTQVVEAGVDISARTLITEIAPWTSIVQRLGRCHRHGELEKEQGKAIWIDLPEKQSAPYEVSDLILARAHLQKLEGKDVSPFSLRTYQIEQKIVLPMPHKDILRRRDLIDLFDTAPDLSGNDIDVARFVRGDDKDTDVSVFWRDSKGDKDAPRREELCPVPVGSMREFIKNGAVAYRMDHLEDEWVVQRANDLRPGLTLLLPCSAGGYDWSDKTNSGLGWCGDPKKTPEPLGVPPSPPAPTHEEGAGTDTLTGIDKAQTLVGHTEDVCKQLEAIIANLPLPSAVVPLLKNTVRWHDVGKGHPVFKASITKINPDLPDGVWAKSGKKGMRHERKHFRHEWASALAMLQAGLSFAEAYLAASHHGRARLTVRALPGESLSEDATRAVALGIWEGDVLPPVELGYGVRSPEVTLNLACLKLGEHSWVARAAALLEEYGPFKLAFLEALIRCADWRASAQPETEVREWPK
ncbi:MAG: CRISPR-associated helicase Cas3' [Gemmataceae bacterium]|nr:CRISPR-associated helicase Cas3' [Gemmataceae bacterium]